MNKRPEKWKTIKYFSRYEASDLGRIRTIESKHIHKGSIDKGGYMKVCLVNDAGKSVTVLAHRLIATTFIPNPENKPQVNHKNFVANDNRVVNLEWVTSQENHNHKMHAGRNVTQSGEKHGLAKYTDKQILEAYKMIISGKYSQREVAEKFGMSYSTVSHIKSGRQWSSVTGAKFKKGED